MKLRKRRKIDSRKALIRWRRNQKSYYVVYSGEERITLPETWPLDCNLVVKCTAGMSIIINRNPEQTITGGVGEEHVYEA
jgi:hypothetical protein